MKTWGELQNECAALRDDIQQQSAQSGVTSDQVLMNIDRLMVLMSDVQGRLKADDDVIRLD